jgi:hydroxymethylbilane synthase
LARWQSDWVAARLRDSGVAVEIVEISTSGDIQQQGPVASLGGLGVFTKEIQFALLAGDVDLAIHSLKDLPTQTADGLILAAVPPRENPADALISTGGAFLANLPAGARVGTGSLRRRAQLLHLRPDLVMLDIRGNVDTRLRKLDAGEYDAIALAAAGLRRLGWAERITDLLEPPRFSAGRERWRSRPVDDTSEAVVASGRRRHGAVTTERAAAAVLHGGCSAVGYGAARLGGCDSARSR